MQGSRRGLLPVFVHRGIILQDFSLLKMAEGSLRPFNDSSLFCIDSGGNSKRKKQSLTQCPLAPCSGKERRLEYMLISISAQFCYVIQIPVSSMTCRECFMSFCVLFLVCVFSAKWILPHPGSSIYPSIVSLHRLVTSSVTWWLSWSQWSRVLCIIRIFSNCLQILMAHSGSKVFCQFPTLCVLPIRPLPWVRISSTCSISDYPCSHVVVFVYVRNVGLRASEWRDFLKPGCCIIL